MLIFQVILPAISVFSLTFDFAAGSAAQDGLEEGLALAAYLLMSSMGLIADIVKEKLKNSKKFEVRKVKITFVIV